MSIGNIALSAIAISAMTILLCAFQAPIFAAVVNAVGEHGYRASFTAVILGSAAGIVGGSTPALMATVTALSGIPTTPAFLIAILSIVAFFTAKNITKYH
jgi:hypothetical protein